MSGSGQIQMSALALPARSFWLPFQGLEIANAAKHGDICNARFRSIEVHPGRALNDKGEICRTYNTPVPGMPNPICNAWAAHKVGDSWQITVNGRTSEVTLVAGIQ